MSRVIVGFGEDKLKVPLFNKIGLFSSHPPRTGTRPPHPNHNRPLSLHIAAALHLMGGEPWRFLFAHFIISSQMEILLAQ